MNNNFFASIKELGWKKFLAFLTLGTLDFLVIGVPYYFKLLVPNIQNYLGVEEADISRMTSLIGSVTLLTQLSGGYLTDKFSSKKLLISAVTISAAAMFWFAGLITWHDGYSIANLRYQYYIIYVIWGISSTPLFWAPLWKLVSQQVGRDKQGFAFGLQGGLNGAVGIILFCIFGFAVLKYTEYYESHYLNVASVSATSVGTGGVPGAGTPAAAAAVAAVAQAHQKFWSVGFGFYIFVLAAILAVTAFGIHFFVKERKSSEKSGVTISGLSRVMCNWKIWGLSIFLLGMYMFQSPIAYYLYQMLTNVNKLDGTLILIIPVLRIFILRLAISFGISKWSEKMKSFIFLLIFATTIALVLMIIIIFMPGITFNKDNYFETFSHPTKIFISTVMTILVLMVGGLSWIMVALRYPQAQEINLPRKSYGTVTAVISFIGFSPDSWFFALGSFIQEKNKSGKLDKYGKPITTQTGYQIILLIAIIFVLIGLFAGFLVWNSERKLMREHNLRFHLWRGLNND